MFLMREMSGLSYDEIANACELTRMPFAIESIAPDCNCERSSRRRSAPCAEVRFDPSVDRDE